MRRNGRLCPASAATMPCRLPYSNRPRHASLVYLTLGEGVGTMAHQVDTRVFHVKLVGLVRRKPYACRTNKVVEMGSTRSAGYGHNPWLARQHPHKRELRRRDALAPRPAPYQLCQRPVVAQGLRSEARQIVAAVITHPARHNSGKATAPIRAGIQNSLTWSVWSA